MNGEGLRAGEQLVNIQNLPSLGQAVTDPREAAKLKLHPTLETNIAAWDEFWATINLHALCRACFAGERLPGTFGSEYYSHTGLGGQGCCRGCVNLSNQRCVAKPNNCASWICGTAEGILQLRERFPYSRWLWNGIPYRAVGFRCLRGEMTKAFLTDVRREAQKVRRWTAKVRREAGMDVGEPT